MKCPICGMEDDPEDYIESPIKEIMKEKGCCFRCAFWFDIANGDPDLEDPSQPVVVNHTHWSYRINHPIQFMESHGWSMMPIPTMHYILFFNGDVVTTNCLWHQGDIPEYFQEMIPDNAKFLTREQFDMINHHVSNQGKSQKDIKCPKELLKQLLQG